MSESYEAAVEVREAICASLPGESERRRYALLAASAALYPYLAKHSHRDDTLADLATRTVNVAEVLLREIESGETK